MPAPAGTTYILAPWEWTDTAGTDDTPGGQGWHPPAGSFATLDRRNNAQCALKGTQPAEGFGFFAMNPGATIPAGAIVLGNSLGTRLTASQQSDMQATLGLDPGDLGGATLLDDMWRAATDLADPTGANRVKPIMPKVDGTMEWVMTGHSVVKSEQFDRAKHPFVQAAVRLDYADFKTQNPDAELEARVLLNLRRQYGFTNGDIITPSGGAVAADDFNRSSAAAMGTSSDGDWSWTEVDGDWDIVNNTQVQVPQAAYASQASTYPATARSGKSLDSADHRAAIDFVSRGDVYAFLGPAVRFSASAETCYYGLSRGLHAFAALSKIIAGTNSTIVYNNIDGTDPPHTDRVEINGSTLRLLVDSVEIFSTTDANITGHLQTGLAALGTTSGISIGDNFSASDILPQSVVPIVMRRRHA
ncbi:MAG: hypothetical protein O3B04_09630 [Chloroflexi bacterium]|nr:hypothetical protein [Chloroflexota bacterium]